jgi:hypothetical protein
MKGRWTQKALLLITLLVGIALPIGMGFSWDKSDKSRAAQEKEASYLPGASQEDFRTLPSRLRSDQPGARARRLELLQKLYDLSDQPARALTLIQGKPVQAGVRVELPQDLIWEQLAALSLDDLWNNGLFPAGFLPLPHPDHPQGGVVFPRSYFEAVQQQ